MEYSIQELSKLSGVTTRTLRWYDQIGLLKGHLTALEAERQRLEGLIHSLKITIRAEERNEIMNDQEKFEAFKKHAVEEHEKNYGKEAREKYGDAQVDKMQETVMNLTKEQYQEWMELGQRIQGLLETAVTGQADPKEEVGREITALHKR